MIPIRPGGAAATLRVSTRRGDFKTIKGKTMVTKKVKKPKKQKTKAARRLTVQDVLKSRLIAERDEGGKSIKEVALLAGVSPPTLTRWVSESASGRAAISANTIDRLAEHFGLSLQEN